MNKPIYNSKTYDLCFYVLGNEENLIDSNVNITNKEVMKGDLPMPDGIYDAHMGTTDHAWNCLTCGNRKSVCPGHFGTIDLKYPVKSPMFRDELLKWLKVTCYKCGSLLLGLKRAVKPNRRLNELVKNVRGVKSCPSCGEPHAQVAKDKRRTAVFYRVFEDGKTTRNEEYYNHLIEQALERISDSTVIFMGKPLRSHPRKFVIRNIRVPPNTVRPDIRRIGGARSSNSDATSLLKTIAEINEALPDEIPEVGQIDQDLRDMYFNLDMAYFAMIKGGGGGEVKLVTNTNKPPVAFAERLPKKTGRIRRNLMGKHVSYMIRSVISGDPRMKINEVGVPISHARNLEIPETVSARNRDRLMSYFLNGKERYPGCRRIIKKSDGHMYRIEHMENYQLQEGDVVMRDMVTGDVINYNRQPSLRFASIACMRVVVMTVGDTLRMNPAICNFFNADFDGDQMNVLVPQNIMSRNEIMKISKASRWFISMQNHAPLIGIQYDSLIGTAELTKHGLRFNKWHAMCLLGDVESAIDYNFTEKSYTNRELVSRLLPKINFLKRAPSIYRKEYAELLKYNPEDIEVNIVRGKLISGILDKKNTGQNVMGSIFHVIANEYGNDFAMETIYNFQLVAHRLFLQHGFTCGIGEINISEDATKEIKRRIAGLIVDSRKITDRLNNGKLIAPIGMSLFDFYENEQINALSPGDDFVNPILADMNLAVNCMARMILAGSKGDMPNFIAINAAVGMQSINGARFGPQAGWGKNSPYFTRYDTEPAASGYISTSYREGISSDVYPYIAAEARDGLISNALKTSITGYQSRISTKNLETILTDNLHKSTKNMNVVQPLYADCGLDPSKTELVVFPTVMISKTAFENEYRADIKLVDKRFHRPEVEKALAEEFTQLEADRAEYRRIFKTIENHNPKEYIMENSKQMPVNVQRVIDDAVFNYAEMVEELDQRDRVLDPLYAIQQVRTLCDELSYVFMNEAQHVAKKPIPEYMRTATKLMAILIRSYLNVATMIKKGVINCLLDIIYKQIIIIYKKALIDAGTSVGIISAQCLSEPLTQFVLNSKHRAGGHGGTKTNEIIRIQEILGAKDTLSMKNPHMLILVKEEYESNKTKVQEIANHIEMMQFERFVLSTRIFFEEFGDPVHPDFKHEANIISHIEKHNYGQKRPNDLAKWCIRFGIDKKSLIIKSMKLETIILAIRKTYPQLFVVYSPENADDIFVRCYLRNSMFKQSANYYEDNVLPMANKIKKIVVRGINGLISTNTIDVIRTIEKPDGSLERKKVFGVLSVGTNMAEVLSNPYIDPYRTQSDSIEEVEKVFGVVAARNKIINELVATFKSLSKFHCSIFADEMTYSGSVTSIQKTGLQKREMANVTLRLSFQTPIQVIQDAAINGMIDRIGGVSGPLVMGTNPSCGSTFNQIYVNEEFIKENVKSADASLADL